MTQDLEQVRQAIYRYARGVDRMDAALIGDAFWPDARITMGAVYAGPPSGFVDVALGFMGMFAATRHDVANISMTAQGDSVGYEAYVRAWHWQRDKACELFVLGRYIGRAERREGVWRIADHGELLDWGEERPVSAEWFEANAELEKGQRTLADGSYLWLAAKD